MKAPWPKWAQSPPWQQYCGLLAVAVFILLLAALALWRPLWTAYQQAQRQEPQQREAYERTWQQAQQLPLWLARQPLAEAALRQQQARLPTAVPVDLAPPLHQLLATHNVTLSQARPLPIDMLGDLQAHPYLLSGSGEVAAVLGLIQAFSHHPEGLILTRLHLSLAPNHQPPQLTLEAQLHTLRLPPDPTDVEAADATL
ncbi:hypothetical protein AB8Q18_13030 [Neisseriaceae bacterium CLB008]